MQLARSALSPRTFLLLVSEQIHRFGAPSHPLVRAPFCGADPTMERISVELRQHQPVEERSGGWIASSSARMSSARSSRCGLSGCRTTSTTSRGATPQIPPPSCTEHDPKAVVERFDRGSDVHSVDGARNPMVGLGAPPGVWVERDWHHDRAATVGCYDGRVGARQWHPGDVRSPQFGQSRLLLRSVP